MEEVFAPVYSTEMEEELVKEESLDAVEGQKDGKGRISPRIPCAPDPPMHRQVHSVIGPC